MKNKIKTVLYNIMEYWNTQKMNFYFGMVLCALFVLNIPICVPEILGLVLAPVLSVILYLLIWLFNCRKKVDRQTFLKNTGMTLSGSLLTIIFATI